MVWSNRIHDEHVHGILGHFGHGIHVGHGGFGCGGGGHGGGHGGREHPGVSGKGQHLLSIILYDCILLPYLGLASITDVRNVCPFLRAKYLA